MHVVTACSKGARLTATSERRTIAYVGSFTQGGNMIMRTSMLHLYARILADNLGLAVAYTPHHYTSYPLG